jgi:hypothetical protein
MSDRAAGEQAVRLTEAQRALLSDLNEAPLVRRQHLWATGWVVPGFPQVVRENTANVLIRQGLAEIVGIGRDACLTVTPAGRAALAQGGTDERK